MLPRSWLTPTEKELTGDGYEDMANSWKQYEHKREGDVFYDPTGNVRESPCHPVVEQVAKLGLYTDPVVTRNTAVSDFRIRDIMDNALACIYLNARSGVFEQAIAYFGGWNIKAYLICQNKAQLDAAYDKDELITLNCHVTVAYAPNKV